MVLSCVQHFETPWTIASQAPLSMELSRREYWSELPFPPPGDLSDPGIEPASPVSPALAGRFVTTEPPGKAMFKQKSWSLTPYLRSIFLCYSCPRMTKTETKELFLILATFIPLSLNRHRVPYILSSEFSQTLLVFFIFTLNCLCYNLIIGLPSHHLCPILWVTSESQILHTPKGKNL